MAYSSGDPGAFLVWLTRCPPVCPPKRHLSMDAPPVIAKRTAKRHRPHSATAAAVGALLAWARRNVSSPARAPNVASASAHSVRASP
jgi:hypothetical protein